MTVREKMSSGAAAGATDLLLSTQVGEFIVQERIGAGGMGVVYRAVHPLIGKQVAIKVLRPELVSEQQVERLLIEARSVNAIRHPGIIDIFGFGKLADGRPYITMELLQGATLGDLIRQQGRLDVATTVWILDQVLAALGAAHRAGVVHRDLKPGNIFLAGAAEGARSVKLVDFGIAKILESHEGPTTVDGTILGTPEFMSPEQIRGNPAGPPADLYAVGIIAFQMLTGARPFNGEPLQILFAHVEQTPPLPSSRVPGIPPEFDTLILHLLAKDPSLRPESAESVRQALKRISVFQPTLSSPMSRGPEATRTSASESETRTMPPLEVRRTHPPAPASGHGRRAVIGAALLAGLGGGAFLFWPSHPVNVSSPASTTGTTPPAAAEVGQVRPPVPTELTREAPPPAVQPTRELVPAEEVLDVAEQAPTSKPDGQGNTQATGADPKPKKARPRATHESRPQIPDGAGTQLDPNGQVQPSMKAPPTPEVGMAPQQPQASPPTLSASKPTDEHRAKPPLHSQQPTGPESTRSLSEREIQELQRGLVASIDEAEQWFRAKAGRKVDGSRQLSDLQELRRRALTTTTHVGRISILDGLSTWKGLRMGQPEPALRGEPAGQTSVAEEAARRDLLASIDEAEKWLRAKAGTAVNGSMALAELQKLRLRAQAATTPEERNAIREDLALWRRNRGGKATGAAP